MDALDVWAEGVRFPAVKIIEAGKERRDILYMLQANNRLPTYMGDIRAQIGACRVGVRRLKDLTARYGAATVKQCRRLHDLALGGTLPRRGPRLASGSLRGRRLRRPRPPGQRGHPRPLRGDGPRRRTADRGLRRLRHPRQPRLVQRVREHPRLRRLPTRGDDGSRHPQERGLLQQHRDSRPRRNVRQPPLRQDGRGGDAPPR